MNIKHVEPITETEAVNFLHRAAASARGHNTAKLLLLAAAEQVATPEFKALLKRQADLCGVSVTYDDWDNEHDSWGAVAESAVELQERAFEYAQAEATGNGVFSDLSYEETRI